MNEDGDPACHTPTKAVVAGVKEVVSAAFGPRAGRLAFSRLSNAGSSADFKIFWKVTVSGRSPQVLFVKQSDKKLQGFEIDAYLSLRDVPVPAFIGHTSVAGGYVYVWRHVEGHAAENFSSYGADDVQRVARAVALIVARTQDVAQHLSLPTGMAWVGPKTEELESLAFITEQKKWARAFRSYAAREKSVLERLAAIETGVLTHNDVKAPNVLLGDNRVTIVDWDSASLGPHGASLRVFARSRHALDVIAASAYVEALRENGLSADLETVLFVLRAQEVFWGLSTGLKRQSPGRIAKGLRLAQTAFADFD